MIATLRSVGRGAYQIYTWLCWVIVGLGGIVFFVGLLAAAYVTAETAPARLAAAQTAFEAWLNTPPACSYRLVPQRDGTILAYRC